MTTTYLGQPVQDLTKYYLGGPQDFTEHYPQYSNNGEDLWKKYGAVKGGMFYQNPQGIYFWCMAMGACDLHKEWLDKDKLILTDNEQWANDLCAAGYKVGLKTIIIMSAPTPSVEVEDNKEEVVSNLDKLTDIVEDLNNGKSGALDNLLSLMDEINADKELRELEEYNRDIEEEDDDTIEEDDDTEDYYGDEDEMLEKERLLDEYYDREYDKWEAWWEERGEQEMLEEGWHREEEKQNKRVRNLNKPAA